nr:MAG TPA: tail tube protein [Bacteriophage sp.]
MFQSREYEWSDVSVVLAGRLVTGIRGIKYKDKQEKEHLYAKGNKTHSIQHGNIEYSGEISLVQSEYLALRKACKGNILNASVDIVVSYGNPSQGDAITTDVLIGCEFTEDNTEWKQGDKSLEKVIPFLFLDKK